MVQELQVIKELEENQRIEFIRQWVSDLYRSGVFYSFSLHTLELSRRFQNLYRKVQHSGSQEDLMELQLLSDRLEQKLAEEKLH